jgi:predicted component of type VI protein secretion system
MLEKAQFYIAIMAGVPEEKVVREVPLKAKISSLDRVNLLIAQAVRGVPVKHLLTPPAEIPGPARGATSSCRRRGALGRREEPAHDVDLHPA